MVSKNQKRKNAQQKQQAARAIQQIHGQGGYYTDHILPFLQKAVPKGTFAKLGGTGGAMLGKAAGMPGAGALGGFAGAKLGGKISQILGFGDYTVTSNTIAKMGTAVPEGQPIPTFQSMGHETRICHREYVQDIVVPAVPAAFTNLQFTINAGNVALFPWLATIASQFQQYRFNGMVIEYRTLSSDITAGGALGSVILATEYDVISTPYASKIAMENSQYAVSAKPSLSQMHAVECDPSLTSNNLYYVRDAGASSATSDSRFYDLGNFQLATQGLPGTAGAVLGELWVSYDVTLLKPEISSPGGAIQKVASGGTTSKAAIFGASPVETGANFCDAVTNTLTFSTPGEYEVVLATVGTGLVVPTTTGTASTATVLSTVGTTPTIFMSLYRVTVTAQGQTVIFDGSGSTTTTSSLVWITKAAAQFLTV